MRKKLNHPPALSSWTDVDDAMRQIGECERQLDKLQVELNRQIAAAKEKAEKKAQPIQDKIKKLAMDVKEFVQQNRSEMDGKTKQLNFGKTGYRLSTKLMTPKTAEIIDALKRHDMLDCITVKESINKEELKRRPADDILKVGAYLKSDDEFWYEVDKTKLESTA